MVKAAPQKTATVSLLFFLSGATGLVYQIAWSKYLALALGSTALAHAFVLSLFLGGLAAGNAFFGPRADRSPSPLRLYAALEVAVAFSALLSLLLLHYARSIGLSGAMCLSALALLPPTIAMGGTLPALSRWKVRDLAGLRPGVSWLYGINSAGAVAGAATAGFFLLPRFGLRLPVLAAAALNVAIALAAWRLDGPKPSRTGAKKKLAPLVKDTPLYTVIFLSGLASLAYEIGWIRLLSLSLGSSAYAFTLMLVAFITGIALGSWIMAQKRWEKHDPRRLLIWAECAIAVSIVLTWPLYERLPYLTLVLRSALPKTAGGFALYSAIRYLFCLGLMVLPTAAMGATLPLATRAVSPGAERAGGSVGAIFAANTLGNVLGAFIGGLFLLPAFGLRGLFLFCCALNTGLAGALAFTQPKRLRRPWRPVAVTAVLVLLHAIIAPQMDRLSISTGAYRRRAQNKLSFEEFRQAAAIEQLLYYKDGRDLTVSVTANPAGTRYLKLNGKTDASTGEDMATQAIVAHLPMLLHPDPKAVMIVGLGSGVTAGAALRHSPAVIDTVEISRGVVDAAHFFKRANMGALLDPRHNVHIADARRWLAHRPGRYDLIISEPTNPWISGVGNLFSFDFYTLAKSRLNSGGIFVQWFHLYEMSDEVLRTVLRTFSASFAHVSLWNVSSNDVILMGSRKPLAPDFKTIESRFRNAEIREALKFAGIGAPATLLSLESLSDATLRRAAGEGPLNTDRRPRLEYDAPLAMFFDRTTTLLIKRDDRQSPATGARLLLPRYLHMRQQGLDRGELADMVSFHGRFGGPVHNALRREWKRRYGDKR